jgi:hypothetical protein
MGVKVGRTFPLPIAEAKNISEWLQKELDKFRINVII